MNIVYARQKFLPPVAGSRAPPVDKKVQGQTRGPAIMDRVSRRLPWQPALAGASGYHVYINNNNNTRSVLYNIIIMVCVCVCGLVCIHLLSMFNVSITMVCAYR